MKLADLVRPWKARFHGSKLELTLRFLPLAGYMAGIFYLSSIPGTDLPTGIDDRMAHTLAYWGFGLAILLSAAALTPLRVGKLEYVLAWTFGAVYALSDEFHQSFVPGREASFKDFGFDLFGLCLSVVLIEILLRVSERA